MSNEEYLYSKDKKEGSFSVSEGIPARRAWSYNESQKSGDYSVNIGIKTPSWNQVIDDSAPDWTYTWDWVFSKSFDNLTSENWEDWG